MSKNIESILTEKRHFEPSAEFSAQANIKHEQLAALHARAERDYEGFWADLAREHLHWSKDFSEVLDDSRAPHYRWFGDGELNVSYNCLDRHLAERGDKTAIIFEGEQGDTLRLSYTELHREVCRFANVLKGRGITQGDRVVLYMPMTHQAIIAMQACARIGAIQSVVFGGFSAEALKDRIEDSQACAVITADGGTRGGGIVTLKDTVDQALAMGGASVASVLVFRRSGQPVALQEGRDYWVDELLATVDAHCPATSLNAEHPLFLLYTSGSTGKPKGIQHASAGYLLNAVITNQWVFDLKDDDIFWCTADVGWITGHSYVSFGPLAAGGTVLVYEGAPLVPDAGRFWRMVQDHRVSIFYTAPTAIRALMKYGDTFPQAYDLSSLRLLGTVGEPINPEAWMWYHHVIGQARCPVVDTWWQTETGANMIAPLPGVTPTKPGSCTLPLPGIMADIVDDDGNSISDPHQGGYLVIKKPWPSMLRNIWGDEQRYKDTYWPMFDGRYYLAGDSAHKDEDGCFWILGRIDDVVNVSGHRLGTMEIESALVAHPKVIEAAVVGVPHDVKGESLACFVVLKGERPANGSDKALDGELRDWVGGQIGSIAKPDTLRYADNLPKTRSGKIMRRLLRSLARGEAITGDTSTLENAGILEQLRGEV
ncbi:MAG: acetate--CoA ligase [Gammaproteobacteria bacterium]|nr:MAG: acetate--CoA ligase [Gammaproteobacteria bacterium]